MDRTSDNSKLTPQQRVDAANQGMKEAVRNGSLHIRYILSEMTAKGKHQVKGKTKKKQIPTG